MYLKKEIAAVNTALSKILSFFLVILGLALTWLFQSWMPPGSPFIHSYSILFISGALGIGAGLFFHEYYRHLMSKLMGLDSVLVKKPEIKAVITSYTDRWKAVGITLAPATDLTIIAVLAIFLTNSWLITAGAVIFLAINLMLSAKDIVTVFLIYKYANTEDFILFTQEGFQVWAVNDGD